jgi:hypothetical protein
MRSRLRYVSTVVLMVLALTVPAIAQELEYDVRVVFTGVMTFVPGDKQATVIIPILKNGGRFGDDDHLVDPHVAYVLASKKVMDEKLELNDDLAFEDANFDADHYHYVTFDGDAVSLDEENDVAALNSPLSYRVDGVDPCPVYDGSDPEKHASLFWVPGFARVRADASLKREEKYFERHPKRKDVSARMIMRYGKLQAHVISPGEIWEFRTPIKRNQTAIGKTIVQAAAEEVHWTFRARGNPFVLNLLSFEGTSRRIAFTPPTSGELEIYIGQTMHADTGPVTAGDVQPRDEHYSAHHRLVAGNPGGKGQIPHDTGTTCKDKGDAYVKGLWERQIKVLTDAVASAAPAAVSMPAPMTSSMMHGNDRSARPSTPSDGNPAPSGLNCIPTIWP